MFFSFDVGTSSSSLAHRGWQGPPLRKESDSDGIGGTVSSNTGLGRLAGSSEGVPAACVRCGVAGVGECQGRLCPFSGVWSDACVRTHVCNFLGVPVGAPHSSAPFGGVHGIQRRVCPRETVFPFSAAPHPNPVLSNTSLQCSTCVPVPGWGLFSRNDKAITLFQCHPNLPDL